MPKIEIGDIFWCIKATEECEAYGNNWPVAPREMQVVKHNIGVYMVSRVANGVVDTDPNASCILSSVEANSMLFEDKEEAKRMYISLTLKKIRDSQKDMLEKIEDISDTLLYSKQ